MKKTFGGKNKIIPKILPLDIIGRDKNGELIAKPVKLDFCDKILIQQNKKTRIIVGVNDRILARIEKKQIEKKQNIYYAKTIKKIKKQTTNKMFAIYIKEKTGDFLQPIEKKLKKIPITKDSIKAQHNDLIEIEQEKTNIKIKKIYCNIENEKSASLIALHQHNIPYEFNDKTLQEVENIKTKKIDKRQDLSHIPFLTIDPKQAKDHDDAIYTEIKKDSIIIYVAIADVCHYVKPGSEIDKHAEIRSNSVYLPDCTVPMLPPKISNDLCSLKENKKRPALCAIMQFNKQGKIINYNFQQVIIKVKAKLSYEQAQNIIDEKEKSSTLLPLLQNIKQAYEILQKENKAREPLGLTMVERQVELDEKTGKIKNIKIKKQLLTHKIVEEFMIKANVSAANMLEKTNAIYRIHDSPNLEKLQNLKIILKTLKLSLPKASQLKPHHFNSILAKVKNTHYNELIHQAILRTQAQAEYSTQNIGHFGLNLPFYTHFTSPIRRYSDLLIHRWLIAKINKQKITPYNNLENICKHISNNERRAMLAERQSLERLVAFYLVDKIGQQFTAHINGIAKAGIFITLQQSGADGFIPIKNMQDDYYIYNKEQFCIYGEHKNFAYQMGDEVKVQLIKCQPLSGDLIFAMISNGKKMNISRHKRHKTRKKTKGKRKRGKR